jgi:hypothetical protein
MYRYDPKGRDEFEMLKFADRIRILPAGKLLVADPSYPPDPIKPDPLEG